MLRVFLIRHGEKEREFGNPPLTALGHQQAEATGKFLRELEPTHVFASPLRRTQQTAVHIVDALKLPIHTDARLIERANWGDLPQQTQQQFEQMWEKANDDRDWQPPVGDSSIKAGNRVEELIHELATQNIKLAICITHGGVISDFVRNISTAKQQDELLPGFSEKIDDLVHTCSITEITCEKPGAKLKLVQLASIDHLPEELR